MAYDVRGVEIEVGQHILYTEHNSGTFCEAVVVEIVNEEQLKIMTRWSKKPTKKSTKYVVVK